MTSAWNQVRPTRKRNRDRHTSSGKAPPEGTRAQSRLKNGTMVIDGAGRIRSQARARERQARCRKRRRVIPDTYTATPAERWTISVRRVEEAWPERQAHSAEPIDTVLLAERPGYAGARSWGVWGAISWPPIPLAAIDGADHRPQRGGHDVGVEADAPADLAAVHARLDVSGRAGVRPFAEGV